MENEIKKLMDIARKTAIILDLIDTKLCGLDVTEVERAVINMMILGSNLCSIAEEESFPDEMRIHAHRLDEMLKYFILKIVNDVEAEQNTQHLTFFKSLGGKRNPMGENGNG